MMVRIHEERGMAMVVALLVSFAVLILSTVVVAQSIHSNQGTGYDRQRLESVNAAEAGTNYWYTYLQTTPSASLSCNAVTQTLGSGPAIASFTATPTFYNSAGTVVTCPFTDTTYPAYALINSTGTTSGQAARKFQTYLRLTPNYGGFSAAILSNAGNVTISNNFDIYGNNGSNGDIYVLSGNYSQGNNSTVRGSVYVPNGTVTMTNSSTVTGDVWSLGNATITSVSGNVTSTTGNITGGTVGQNAAAAGTITGTVNGTRSPNQTGLANPPSAAYPTITYNAANWTGAGYTINTFATCAAAKTFVQAGITGNQVVRITPACDFQVDNNQTVSLNGNLAIISDGSFTLNNRSNWNGVTSLRSLYFISTYAIGLNCATAGKNISTANNTNFNSLVNVSFYSPCTTSMGNTSSFSGQVFGNPVAITNQFTMTYQPVLIPGVTGIVGFNQDISYVREVA